MLKKIWKNAQSAASPRTNANADQAATAPAADIPARRVKNDPIAKKPRRNVGIFFFTRHEREEIIECGKERR